MSVDTDYSLVFAIPSVTFIGGNTWAFEYTAIDENNDPVDLSASDCSWSLAYFSDPSSTVVTKVAVVSGVDNNVMTITLAYADTADIYGKFIQQPFIVDFSGREFRPAQGIVTILPRVP